MGNTARIGEIPEWARRADRENTARLYEKICEHLGVAPAAEEPLQEGQAATSEVGDPPVSPSGQTAEFDDFLALVQEVMPELPDPGEHEEDK